VRGLSVISYARQVTYIGNTTLRNGYNDGTSPTGSFTLANGKQIIAIDGTSRNAIYSLGFTTNKGNRYGPWGNSSEGTPFRLEGPVYGFYGGRNGPDLSAFGTWTVPSSTVTPSPPPPHPPAIPGRIQSPTFGGQSNPSSTWDDCASFTGPCPSHMNIYLTEQDD
jgi:hypothetical protein